MPGLLEMFRTNIAERRKKQAAPSAKSAPKPAKPTKPKKPLTASEKFAAEEAEHQAKLAKIRNRGKKKSGLKK